MGNDSKLRLIERIAAASGPCVGLDADIEHATGRWSDHHFEAWARWQEYGESASPALPVPVPPNRYTGSIDAAMTLLPSDTWFELKGPRKYLNIPSPAPNYWFAYISTYNYEIDKPGWGATPPLAICAAALKAHLAFDPLTTQEKQK